MPKRRSPDGTLSLTSWNRLPDAKHKAVVDMYLTERVGATTIAKMLGVGSTTVYRLLEEAGINRDRGHLRTGPGRRRFTPAEDREIADKYAAGASLMALAVEYNTTQMPISRAVLRAGGILRKQGKQVRSFTAEQIADMKQMWESGMSQNAIGQKYGAHQTVISNALALHGIKTERRLRSRENHRSWKGGVSVDSQGYVSELLPADSQFASMRNTGGRVMQHRLVMAQTLGRPLLPTETVHHINGDKLDNRPENLEIRQGKHGKHVAFCCADCGSRNIVPVALHSDSG